MFHSSFFLFLDWLRGKIADRCSLKYPQTSSVAESSTRRSCLVSAFLAFPIPKIRTRLVSPRRVLNTSTRDRQTGFDSPNETPVHDGAEAGTSWAVDGTDLSLAAFGTVDDDCALRSDTSRGRMPSCDKTRSFRPADSFECDTRGHFWLPFRHGELFCPLLQGTGRVSTASSILGVGGISYASIGSELLHHFCIGTGSASMKMDLILPNHYHRAKPPSSGDQSGARTCRTGYWRILVFLSPSRVVRYCAKGRAILEFDRPRMRAPGVCSWLGSAFAAKGVPFLGNLTD